MIRDFADERRRIMYEAQRHGFHGPRFARVVPTPEIPSDDDPLLTIVNNTK